MIQRMLNRIIYKNPMSIYSIEGDRVMLCKPLQDFPEHKVGDIFTVIKTYVGPWYTSVKVKGIPKKIGSVYFNEVNRAGQDTDHRDFLRYN